MANSPRQRKDLSDARMMAEYTLGWQIENVIADPTQRISIRTTFIALMLLTKQQKVLTELVKEIPEYESSIMAAVALMHEMVKEDPQHWLMALVSEVPAASGSPGEIGNVKP